MKSESEVTKMCTPADDQILIVGTDVGSLSLYDLWLSASVSRPQLESAGLKSHWGAIIKVRVDSFMSKRMRALYLNYGL